MNNIINNIEKNQGALYNSIASEEIQAFWEETEDMAVSEEIYAQDALYRLASCSIEEMIQLFRHYRLFTIRHIDDIAIVLGRLPFGELKAFFSKVLFEEFGLETKEGYQNNHVALLDAFIISLGAKPSYCSDPAIELSDNLQLLDDISDHVQNSPLAFSIGLRGMGTECLCQVYLTTIFDLVEHNPNFQKKASQLDLRFESLHRGEIEAQHRIQMRHRIADLIHKNPEQLPQLKAGYELARKSFHTFFKNIYQHIDQYSTVNQKPVAI